MVNRFDFVTQVLDSLLASLTKYTALLNPLSPKASVLFGLNDKARMATETIFELANRWVLPVLTVPHLTQRFCVELSLQPCPY